MCKTKVGWIIHIAGVHDRKIQCNDCDKNFPRKYNLKTHKALVHEGKKPFVCSICGQSFSIKNSMSIHNESIHEDKGPLECEVKCKTKIGWIVHIAGVHDIKIQFNKEIKS